MLSRLFLFVALVVVALLGVVAPVSAQQAPLRPKPCPLFLTLDDPAYCSVGLTPTGLSSSSQSPKFLADGSRLVALDKAMFSTASDAPLLAPRTRMPDNAEPLGFTVIQNQPETEWDSVLQADVPRRPSVFRSSNAMQASYGLPTLERIPLFNGLTITSNTGMTQASDEFSAETPRNSANSSIGLAYQARGITVNLNPDVSYNWGDAVTDEAKLGITNQISAKLARDITLTLISGYESFSYTEDPLQNRDTIRNRLAVSYDYGGGYKLGMFARLRNESTYYEERRLIGPGVSVTVPLSDTLNLTTTNEFSITRLNPNEADSSLQYGQQHNFGLRFDWMPAMFASRALTLMAAYSIKYDTMHAEDVGPAQSLARLALAMKF